MNIEFKKKRLAGLKSKSLANPETQPNLLIYRDFYIDQEWKNIKLPKLKLEFDIINESALYITVKSETPAFFVDLFHPKIMIPYLLVK